jgi:hypothetical protein
LASNGGHLDEVVFMMNTRRMEDVQWLDELMKDEPSYRKVATEDVNGHFDNIWNKHAIDENTMYIKIDDDIVGPALHAIRKKWDIDSVVGVHP